MTRDGLSIIVILSSLLVLVLEGVSRAEGR